jgi:hypothetical protein
MNIKSGLWTGKKNNQEGLQENPQVNTALTALPRSDDEGCMKEQ